MDTLSSIDTFRQVVESGSFVAAAERLEVSPATVSKRIMHVEERLGVRLLNRNTRKLSLTDSGRLYFERCKTILKDLQATELELGSSDGAPRGTLRITCPSFAATGDLARLLAAYGKRYPEVLVDVSFEDRFEDLVEDGYDVALRLVADADTLPQGLIARPVRRETFHLAASRQYINRRGLPRCPADLARHDFIALHDSTWSGPLSIPARVTLCCRSTASVVNAVAAGIGVGPVPGAVLDDPLFREQLIPVLPDTPLQRATLYIVYVSRRFVSPKVSAFIEFIVESLSRCAEPSGERRQVAGLRGIQSTAALPGLRAADRQSCGRGPAPYREPARPPLP
ncbi:MAG TPA: LysR family transcriptional regulator [Steroidobacteraceae bacterium]|jgi:DNA-binding transcriptional LysR family regulator|nr:LysR family transcriptional regulator [Steroidobacteraceae bacterium]